MISLSILSLTGIVVMLIHRQVWSTSARWVAILGSTLALIALQFDSLFKIATINITAVGSLWAATIIGLLILILLLIPHRTMVHPLRNDHIALLIFSTIGAVLLTRFDHVVTLLLGLEILSIPLYVLAAQTHSKRSYEASLKYFILGAFSSAVLTFGIALLYRDTGLLTIPGAMATGLIGKTGAILIISSICFKVGLAPFHYWVPDVYEGSPTVFTAFMASVAKVGGFAALFAVSSILPWSDWTSLAIGLGGLSIVLGSFSALQQTSVKRMLAYSSIAQAGFWVLFLGSHQFSVYFAFAYATASVLLFWIYDLVESNTRSHTFAGLMHQNKLLGLIAIFALVSLTGIPPFAGFFAKYTSLFTMVNSNHYIPFGIGLLGSALGAYYYLKHIPQIIGASDNDHKITVSLPATMGAIAAVVALIVFGLVPTF